MRLWSLNPNYLDNIGLVALWREGLLAQKIIFGETTAYKNHPQLHRFLRSVDPKFNIICYLQAVCWVAKSRRLRFRQNLIKQITNVHKDVDQLISCSQGQILYEKALLLDKLRKRKKGLDLLLERRLLHAKVPRLHDIFTLVPGDHPEPWEKVKDAILEQIHHVD